MRGGMDASQNTDYLLVLFFVNYTSENVRLRPQSVSAFLRFSESLHFCMVSRRHSVPVVAAAYRASNTRGVMFARAGYGYVQRSLLRD